jgi:hypothetical protein
VISPLDLKNCCFKQTVTNCFDEVFRERGVRRDSDFFIIDGEAMGVYRVITVQLVYEKMLHELIKRIPAGNSMQRRPNNQGSNGAALFQEFFHFRGSQNDAFLDFFLRAPQRACS